MTAHADNIEKQVTVYSFLFIPIYKSITEVVKEL